MEGLGRAIGAGVPIEFGGETLILDGLTYADFGTIEQHLLSKRPNPMAEARAEAGEFLKEAARLAPVIVNLEAEDKAIGKLEKPSPELMARAKELDGLLDEQRALRDSYLEMADKIVASAREEARKLNKLSFTEVGQWMDTLEGVVFTLWLKLEQRYPGRFSLTAVGDTIMQEGTEKVERVRALRDQASGLDDLGNSTGPTSPETTAAVGPTGG